MRRRAKPQEKENHERWLVSYADFITLLFAFFVMMYANSQVDTAQANQISAAVKKALEEGKVTAALARFLGGAPVAKPSTAPDVARLKPEEVPQPGTSPDAPPELVPSLHQLQSDLAKEIDAGRMEVRLEKRGLVVSLREATFFPSGGDAVEPSTRPVLAKVAAAMRTLPNPIRMEGHTDSIPIRTARFRSNWDLSAARSIAMLELFDAEFGFPRERMAVAGYADTAPVASNETAEGRGRNRRVDIIVLNESAQRAEPKQSAFR